MRQAMSDRIDAVVILGAAVYPGGRPSPTLLRRVEWGIELIKRSEAQWLLASGGVGRHEPSEAQVMRCIAVERGIPHQHILLEERAESTWENARECAKIIREQGWRRVILVTDPYHLPRSLLAFRAFGVDVTPCPICRGHSGTTTRTTLLHQLREIPAIPYYALRSLYQRATGS